MVEITKIGGRVFRINSSAGLRYDRPIYGAPKGFPDLIGWVRVNNKAIFLGIEVKYKNTRITESQNKMAETIKKAGGIHIFWRDKSDIEKIKAIIEQFKNEIQNNV